MKEVKVDQVKQKLIETARLILRPSALGYGLGGLKWSEVQPLIVKHLGALPDLDVYVYEPQGGVAIRSDVEGTDSNTQTGGEKVSARPREL